MSKKHQMTTEALHLLIEECAETIQAATKALRHGLANKHPVSKQTNSTGLTSEIGDIFAAVEILMQLKVLRPKAVDEARQKKLAKIGRWLHTIQIDERGNVVLPDARRA